jgi:hypothetical protein
MSNRGKPMLSKTSDDRCEALTIMTEWKRQHKREERCPFMAKWIVGEHQFCLHHARCEAVAIGVEKGYIKRIAVPPAITGARVRIAGSEE